VQQVKTELKRVTGRAYLNIPVEVAIKRVNAIARGWTNYFFYRHCGNQVANVRSFLENRIRKYLRRRRRKSGWGYKEYSYHYLYKQLGLYKMPTSGPPKRTPVKAFG
jgi:RNA-directed DNA polymerase